LYASNASAAADFNSIAVAQDVKISAAGQDTKAAAPAQDTKQDAKIAVAAQDAKVTAPTIKVATPAQGAKAATSGKQTSSTASSAPAANADNADAAAPADATNAQPWNGGSAPQGQTRTDSDTIMASQSGRSSTTRIDALAATPASEAGGSPATQSGWNAAKAATEGLPNFGIVANQAAPAAAAAASGTAAAATVPIAGLAVAIASRAQAGSSQFDIRLDPPELGRIDVRLDVDRDGQVTSHVTVDRADTLQLLQSQQPQLERALEQAGLKTADNGLQFTLRDQSFAGQNGGSGSGAQSSAAQLVIPDAEAPVIQATQIYSRAGLGSGVDIRV
jgi:chemotaxis protein MotD